MYIAHKSTDFRDSVFTILGTKRNKKSKDSQCCGLTFSNLTVVAVVVARALTVVGEQQVVTRAAIFTRRGLAVLPWFCK